jgi:hypothetical protein
MQKVPKSRQQPVSDDIAPEYRLDYSKAQPNRFAGRTGKKSVVVLLAPDVAKVFKDGEAVNQALRSVIAAYRRRPSPRSAR